MKNNHSTPELLLPAGDTEAFYAAIEGGADAVYAGLKQFSARGRASNFSYPELMALTEEAAKKNIKIYLALNTLIKNQEIPQVLNTLYAISQTKLSAVIIQDWGVYHFIKSYFPHIPVHGSTQMGNHNSAGADYSYYRGFERIIYARELTQQEITQIAKTSKIDLELFVHGALCYSFSGMCLFSSYLGGMSANRGMCMQPCRRLYTSETGKNYLFSLKDNQLIEYIPMLKKLGIRALKVEGRLKPAEYVYRVAKAYRLAIDQPEQLDQAKEMLAYDLGRDKTAYFIGGNIREALTNNPSTGKYAGKIIQKDQNAITIHSEEELKTGNRLWIRSSNEINRKAIKINVINKNGDTYTIQGAFPEIQKGDLVYLANFRQKKFPGKLPPPEKKIQEQMPGKKKNEILQKIGNPGKIKREQLFVRIDSIKWLKKIPFQEIDNLIVSLSEKEWEQLDLSAYIIKKNAQKLFFELPRFIPEEKIGFYKKLTNNIYQAGYSRFMISHLSQKYLVPKEAIIASNENVYVLNDAAVSLLSKEKINLFCYPQENEKENLLSMKSKKGIVPLYFYPFLFYSRMPVKIGKEDNLLRDDKGYQFRKYTKNGINIVIPEQPVSLLQYKEELTKQGFGRYLIDLSYERPSGNRIQTLIKKYRQSEQVQPSGNYNFIKGLT